MTGPRERAVASAWPQVVEWASEHPGGRVLLCAPRQVWPAMALTMRALGVMAVCVDVPVRGGMHGGAITHVLWWDHTIGAVVVCGNGAETADEADLPEIQDALALTGYAGPLLLECPDARTSASTPPALDACQRHADSAVTHCLAPLG